MSDSTLHRPLSAPSSSRRGGPPSTGGGSTGFRRDVQGLRAVAVVAVVLEHVSGWPRGGFVGVDVFFVISGFLITGLLLREHARTGRISLADFYRRRVRRLMPAALVVVATTLLAATVLLPDRRVVGLGVDALYSLAFVANWHFAAVGTDYFTADGPVSAFQHLWSLSVEEQFYAFWPLLVIVVLGFGLRRAGHPAPVSDAGDTGPGRRLVLAAVITLLCAASFVWAVVDTAADPTGAYFSTLTRVWELGLGGLAALAVPLTRRLHRGVGTTLGWLGLVGILASVVVVDGQTAFPGPWAALPVVATLAVVVGGGVPGAVAPAPLANRVTDYLGAISYSLYLWHFPIVVMIRAVLPEGELLAYPLSLGFAVVGHHLVEKPFISSPLLAPRRGEGRRRLWRRWADDQAPSAGRAAIGGLGMLAVVMVVAAVVSVRPVAVPPVLPPVAGGTDLGASVEAGASGGGAAPVGAAEGAMVESVRSALAATSWPSLTPDPGDTMPFGAHNDCGRVDLPLPRAECTFGTGDKTVVLVGDSTAAAELDALVDVVESDDSGWRLVALPMFGCPFVDLAVTQKADPENCSTHQVDAVRTIVEEVPDVLVVTNSFVPFEHADTGAPVTPREYAEALQRQLESLGGAATSTVFVTPPPAHRSLDDCYRPGGSPVDCISSVSSDHAANLVETQKTMEALGGSVVDTSRFLCVDGLCPAFVDGVPVKRDFTHFTGAFDEKLAPVLRELVFETGGDPAP
ncbi:MULTISPECIES: acyltransferase family protein [unclassified Frigoribacterium]|uniref:acyltransferase family protein n=1 Tax=unclassified Frigoribacterium TaxID=2627005 RepID=UPI000A4705F2|nr:MULTISPECIES: acyltransferase family protein [unclassified Frigoribacterium]